MCLLLFGFNNEERTMKKRLRKKLYQGEFEMWYWRLIFEFTSHLSKSRLNEIRKGLFELLDANKLSYSGWSGPPRGLFYINGEKRYTSVTEEHIKLITAWLQALPEVKRVVERPLTRFYGWRD